MRKANLRWIPYFRCLRSSLLLIIETGDTGSTYSVGRIRLENLGTHAALAHPCQRQSNDRQREPPHNVANTAPTPFRLHLWSMTPRLCPITQSYLLKMLQDCGTNGWKPLDISTSWNFNNPLTSSRHPPSSWSRGARYWTMPKSNHIEVVCQVIGLFSSLF